MFRGVPPWCQMDSGMNPHQQSLLEGSEKYLSHYYPQGSGILWNSTTLSTHHPQVKGSVITPIDTIAQSTEETQLALKTRTTSNEPKITLPHTDEDHQSKVIRRNHIIELQKKARALVHEKLLILKMYIPFYNNLLENAQMTAKAELKMVDNEAQDPALDKLTALIFHKQLLFLDELNTRVHHLDFNFDETGIFYEFYEGVMEIAHERAQENLSYWDTDLPYEQAIELDEEAHKLFLDQIMDFDELHGVIIEHDFDKMKKVTPEVIYIALLRYAQVEPYDLLTPDGYCELPTDEEVIQIEEAATDTLQSFLYSELKLPNCPAQNKISESKTASQSLTSKFAHSMGIAWARSVVRNHKSNITLPEVARLKPDWLLRPPPEPPPVAT
eukprot:Tbor_TRINITY_DN5829_c0_g3::TRINITY_DN5829_c0_g3_i7::g.7229::m.7229